MLAARMLSFSCGEEGRELRQPLLAAGHQIPRGERVGELLQALRNCAFQEGVGGLLESDALLADAVGQPMVLGGEWKVRADAHEHPSPIPTQRCANWRCHRLAILSPMAVMMRA